MLRILKYLSGFKASVAAVVFLLVLQAYGDLALPKYTSRIVDVGIQQGGIERAVPEAIREPELKKLLLLMTEAEQEEVLYGYRLIGKETLSEQERERYEKRYPALAEENLYVLKAAGEETLSKLESAFRLPMAMLSYINEGADESGAAPPGTDLSETLLAQRAILYVREEYKAVGIDLGRLQTEYLLRTGAAMLGISVLIMGTAVLIGLLAARTAAGVGRQLRGRVFGRVVSFSHAELDRFSTASLITRSTNDIQQIQMVSVMLLRMVAYAPILGIGGVIQVANTRTGMSWIIVVAVAAVVALVLALMKIAMPKFRKMQELIDRLNLVAREILTGLPVIRAFSRERYEEQRFDRANRDLMDTQLFTNRVMTFMSPVMMLILNGVTLLIVWAGGRRIDLGYLQVGDMMAFITYTMQIVSSFLMLTMVSIMLPRAGVAAKRIDEILETQPAIEDAPQEALVRKEAGAWRGVLEFEDVSFCYPGADEEALSHISFRAVPGKTTAIIGGTGCGKSTLLNLIPRFYDVTKGRVTIDGVDIRTMAQKELRGLLGYVPQKGVLFSGTVESNLKFGGEGIGDAQMKEAAAIAQAEGFITEKPDGYESAIAQGGTNVSGGQKQRLSIARAIAKNPKLYLFDDSFSALDYKTDVTLRRSLAKRTAEATVLIVAQRISTILHADQILVLDEGRLVGIGTHEELLAGCETYREIARSQLSEEELRGSGTAQGGTAASQTSTP